MLEKIWWGIADYSEILSMQHNISKKVLAGAKPQILAGEHHSVITLGIRANNTEIINSELPVVLSERGGLATLHSEGQLVIYPILNLKELNLGVRDYVCLLLTTTKRTLEKFGIKALCDFEKTPGVFTENGKIAFCGIKISQGISMHGISININNDLSLFENLVSCGSRSQKMDRVQNYVQSEISSRQFFDEWHGIFNTALNGRPCRTRTYDPSHVMGMRYQLR